MMMPVEVNQWRATIGCFRLSIQILCPLSKTVSPSSIFLQVFKLCWFRSCFIAISILVLPFVLITQFLVLRSVDTQSCFLFLFARTHNLAKSVIYTTVELLKRIPLAVIDLIRYKCFLSSNVFSSMPTFKLHERHAIHFIHNGWFLRPSCFAVMLKLNLVLKHLTFAVEFE